MLRRPSSWLQGVNPGKGKGEEERKGSRAGGKTDTNLCHANWNAYVRSYSFVKVRLLKNCSVSLYGCELWNLRHASVENINFILYVLESVLKSAWRLPSMCRSSVLEIVADVVPLYNIICLSFTWSVAHQALIEMLNSDSDVVQYVTSYGLQ